MRTSFIMIEEHGYTMHDLNEMTPFEFELQTLFILEYLERKNQIYKQRK